MRRLAAVACVGMVAGFLAFGAAEAKAGDARRRRGGPKEQAQKITLEQLPAAVKDALLKATEGGTLGEIEKQVRDGKTFYEADYMKDGQKMEVRLDPSGKVLAVAISDDEGQIDKADDADNKD
jgi:uncharacterized membrane protein YkoI